MWYPVGGPLSSSSYCVFGDIMTYFLFVCFSPWWILLRSMSLLPFRFSFLIALVFIDFSCDSDGHDADCEEEDMLHVCLFGCCMWVKAWGGYCYDCIFPIVTSHIPHCFCCLSVSLCPSAFQYIYKHPLLSHKIFIIMLIRIFVVISNDITP